MLILIVSDARKFYIGCTDSKSECPLMDPNFKKGDLQKIFIGKRLFQMIKCWSLKKKAQKKLRLIEKLKKFLKIEDLKIFIKIQELKKSKKVQETKKNSEKFSEKF